MIELILYKITMGKYDVLKEESVMLIGERFPARVKWLQVYDATDSVNEEDMRELFILVSQHITKERIPSGSARKFLDGKLLFYHKPDLQDPLKEHKVYCIFTQETDVQTIEPVKIALKEIALRSGVYSAKRFFEEVIELVEHPEKMRSNTEMSVAEALTRIDHYHKTQMDANELGYLISLIDRSQEFDQITLETIYFHVYEAIQELTNAGSTSDPDEFLDGSYLIAQRYQETNNFHLALELYKQIIPIAAKNRRFDLEVACRISIATIYKNFFPNSGKFILETLNPIKSTHLQEINAKQIEIYNTLLGFAYYDLGKLKNAMKYYQNAIQEAQQEINSPNWIAEAYNFLGQQEEERHNLKEATRHYLTAATIAFSGGDIPLADEFRDKAGKTEIQIANSLIHMALVHHMEANFKESEYRSWESLRILIKSYTHINSINLYLIEKFTENIIKYARITLDLPGKKLGNRTLIQKIKELTRDLQSQVIPQGSEKEQLEKIAKEIESNIPLPPPTFLLLTIDGRLMSMGKITDEGWEDPEIEGTLLSGILSAIMSLMTEVSDEVTSLRTVDAGNVQIMIEQSDNAVAALLVDRDVQEFRNRLIRLMGFIDGTYGETIKFWDGDLSIFKPIIKEAKHLLAPSIVAANIDAMN